VEENVMEKFLLDPEAMSLELFDDEKLTVAPHEADQPEGGLTDEHAQSAPEAGVAMLTVLTEQPPPLFTFQVNV
jgi:hypothetical protein